MEQLELERAILNLLLRSAWFKEGEELVLEIFYRVEEKDFTNDVYRRLFVELERFWQKNNKIDPVVFASQLKNKEEKNLIMEILSDDFAIPKLAGMYIQELKKKRAIREIKKVASEVLTSDDVSLEQSIREVAHKIKAITENNGITRLTPVIEEFSKIEEEIKIQKEVFPTGIEKLDYLLDGGFRAGVYAIAGAPFVGKTTFLNYICDALALQGIPSLYLHTEEPRARLVERTLTRIKNEELRERIFLFRYIEHLKLGMDFESMIYDVCRQTNGRFVVIIDSLHNLPTENGDERRITIGRLVRRLYDIVEDLKIPIIFTSFIPRRSYEENPTIGIFKETGDIEYLIDVGLALTYADDLSYDELLESEKVGLRLTLLKDRLGRAWGLRKPFLFFKLNRKELDFEF